MKFNHIVFVVLVILALGLVAFAPFQAGDPPPVDGTPVTVPDYLVVIVTGAIGFLLTAGIKSLSQAIPGVPDLQGPATAITGALVTIFVAVANALLALVPPDYQPLVATLFAALGSILSAYGLAGIMKRFQPKAGGK